MTLEDGVPRAVQEWEHSSNFERMIFYEMAEKFMEFEAEEEQQIQKMKLLANCSQFQAPAPKPTKPPMSPAPESGQQQVYIPKKSASKSRQPRRRQRRPPSTSATGAPREIPAEAVHQYAEIMEGLDTSWEEDEEKKEQGASKDLQGQEDGAFPDPALAQYIDQLCEDEEFVCKVEAVLHPQFMARLLSLEKNQDPLALVEELEEELNLTPNQLTEKRLLALTEEEREPSMYPTSHSDSTPSQSEEEDEVSGKGKGEDASCRAMKASSGSKGVRTSQTELPASVIISSLAPHSQQQLGNRDLVPKSVRAAGRSSLHKNSNRVSQEGNPSPSLKTSDGGQTKHLLGQDHIRDHSIRVTPQVQRVKSEATLNVTGNGNFSGKQEGNRAEEGIPRPSITQHSKQDGSKEDKVKGQLEVPKVAEKSSRVVIVQFHNGSQLVWNNVESANNKYAKQCGSQQEEIRCLKKPLAFQEMKDNVSKEMDHDERINQEMTKIVFGDHVTGGNALKLNLNRHKELNFSHAEKVTGQAQQTRAEDTSDKKEFGCKNREMKPHWNSHMKKSSQEHIHHTGEKQDGCQGEIVRDQCQFQVIWKETKSTPNVTATHPGIVDTSCQSSTGQSNLTSASPDPETELESPKTKVQSQKKPEVGWKQANTTNMKDNSPTKLSIEKLQLQNQSSPIKHQQPDDPSTPETDQEVDLTSHAELTRGNGQLLSSTHLGGIRILDDQVSGTDSERIPCFTCLVMKTPSLRTQKDLERGQKSQQPLAEQCKVNPLVESCSDEKQIIKPTLNPSDPLGLNISAEAEGDSCSPGGDHIPTSTSPSKAAPMLPPQTILQDSSNSSNKVEPTQRYELNVSLSSKLLNVESDTKNTSKTDGGGLNQRVILSNIVLPELPEARTEAGLKYSTKRQKQDEDDELSNFSSLLASKLSLTTPFGHGPLSMEQVNILPPLPTDAGKHGAKTRHSTRGQTPHNMEPSPAVLRSHKRKNNSSGTRRSKRLRNQ
ncbi:NUT family member 1 isoform X2 [Anolis carolinensis]